MSNLFLSTTEAPSFSVGTLAGKTLLVAATFIALMTAAPSNSRADSVGAAFDAGSHSSTLTMIHTTIRAPSGQLQWCKLSNCRKPTEFSQRQIFTGVPAQVAKIYRTNRLSGIIEVTTTIGARVLGLADIADSLIPGKRADLTQIGTTDIAIAPIAQIETTVIQSAMPANVDTAHDRWSHHCKILRRRDIISSGLALLAAPCRGYTNWLSQHVDIFNL